MRPVLAVSWVLWQRNRIALAVIAVYLLVYGSALAGLGYERIPLAALVVGTLLVAFGYLYLFGVFVQQDADVGSPRSTLPGYLMWAPASAAKLTLTPMFLGTVVVGGTTFLLTAAVRQGGGGGWAAYLPTFTAISVLALLQMIFWSPTGFAFSKLILSVLLIPGLLFGIAAAANTGTSEVRVCVALSMLVLICYAGTVVGVTLARRGDEAGLELGVHRRTTDSRPRSAFQSTVAAQRWYEWRQQGLVLPIIVVLLSALVTVPSLVTDDTLSPIWALKQPGSSLLPAVPTMAAVYFPSVLIAACLAAWMVGCGTRRSEIKNGHGGLHLYFLTRPLDEWGLVAPKLYAATRSVLLSWLLIGLCAIPTLLMSGGYYDLNYGMNVPPREPVFLVLFHSLSWDQALRYGLLAILLLAAMWRAYIVGFWTEMSGRLWLRYAYPASVVIGVGLLSAALSNVKPGTWLTIGFLAGLVWALVALKLAAAAFLAVRQVRAGMISPRRLLVGSLVYTAAVFGLGAATIVAFAQTSAGLLASIETPISVTNALFAGLVVLWMPIVRILACPLLLASSRHS